MRTTRIASWAGAVLAAVLVLTVPACGGSGSDKAGGEEERQPVVLTLASVLGERARAARRFCRRGSRLSDGTLRVEFAPEWRPGESEHGAGNDRGRQGRQGRHGLGRGARLRHAGCDELPAAARSASRRQLRPRGQGLRERAPREDALERRRARPRRDRRASRAHAQAGGGRPSRSCASPTSRGSSRGAGLGTLAERTFEALGATVRSVPAGGSLDGLDGLEQQLGSIWANRYDNQADSVTVQPEPLAAPARDRHGQAGLRVADAAAADRAPGGRGGGDSGGAGRFPRGGRGGHGPTSAERDLPFVTSSTQELAELRRALEPVYAELASDAEAKPALDAISEPQIGDRDLRGGACLRARIRPYVRRSGSASSIPDGTYETTVTEADWLNAGLSKEEAYLVAHRSVQDGLRCRRADHSRPAQLRARLEAIYTVFRDQITAEDSVDTFTARWSLEGDSSRLRKSKEEGYPSPSSGDRTRGFGVGAGNRRRVPDELHSGGPGAIAAAL